MSILPSSTTPKSKDVGGGGGGGGGCGKLLDTHTPTSQDLLVSLVFGTVSSLHPSFLLSFILVSLIFLRVQT